MTMTIRELQMLLIEAVYDGGQEVQAVKARTTMERQGFDVILLNGTRYAVSLKDTTGTVKQQKARSKKGK